MKTNFILLLTLILFATAEAQSLERSVTGSAGSTIGNPASLTVDYTVGEIAITSLLGTSAGLPPVTYRISQGFFQGISVRQVARMASGEFQEMEEAAMEQQTNSDAQAGFRMRVYPNPTSGSLKLDLNGTLSGITRYNLVNTKGQLVFSGDLLDVNTEFDLSTVEPGVYFLQIDNPETKINRTFRIVKQ